MADAARSAGRFVAVKNRFRQQMSLVFAQGSGTICSSRAGTTPLSVVSDVEGGALVDDSLAVDIGDKRCCVEKPRDPGLFSFYHALRQKNRERTGERFSELGE
jgi:hypothetical protein